MGGFSGTLHSDIGTILHKVPIPIPLYDRNSFVIHAWGYIVEYEFI
jgi:hypothetical protein